MLGRVVTTGWRAHVSSGQCPQQWDIPAIVSSTQLHCSNYGHVRRQLRAPELLSCYQSHLLSVQLQGGMRDLQYMYRRGEEKLMGTGSAILRWNSDNQQCGNSQECGTQHDIEYSSQVNDTARKLLCNWPALLSCHGFPFLAPYHNTSITNHEYYASKGCGSYAGNAGGGGVAAV